MNTHNIIVVGTNFGVGKSSLVNRLIGSKFSNVYTQTYSFQKYTLNVNNLTFNVFDTFNGINIEDYKKIINFDIPTTAIIIYSKDQSHRGLFRLKTKMENNSDHQVILCNKCDSIIDYEDKTIGIPISIKMNVLPFNIYPFNILGYSNTKFINKIDYM